MERLIPEIVNGIVLGAFYAIIAIGLSLIMNLTGTVNLAHGSFLTLAGYLAFTLIQRGTNFWLALGISAILTVVIGLAVERTLIQPLYKRIPLYSLLLTFGLALIAEEVFRLIWGPQSVPFSPPASLQGATIIGDTVLPTFRLAIVAVLAVAMAMLLLFLYRTRQGLRLRGAVLNREMMAALGINTQMLYMMNFGIGIFLAAIAGVLASGLIGLSPTMGNGLLMPAFITVVIGGMGSIAGSLVGGLLLGVGQSVTTLYAPAASEIVTYVLMAVVLLIRPRGLFGEEGLFG
ncbi:MAG: branched-chain amino acid ABC transporter permease [Vulcanimicrobiaceae bacterium]|jgi:branched-chain amino acid transport system permease protein